MSNQLIIRPAARADLSAIGHLWRELGWLAWICDGDPAAVEAAMSERLDENRANDDHVVLVAQNGGGRVLGYTAMHFMYYLMSPGPEGFVSELFVSEAARGQGVGRRLLERLEELARERGCHRLMLINNKDRESYARDFYKKQGWTERTMMANFVLPLMDY